MQIKINSNKISKEKKDFKYFEELEKKRIQYKEKEQQKIVDRSKNKGIPYKHLAYKVQNPFRGI